MTATLLSALVAYAVVVVPASILLAAAWRLAPSLGRAHPSTLLALRLLPSVSALAAAVVVAAAFVRHEPSGGAERYPGFLYVLAAITLALAATAVRRALAAHHATARVLARWERGSERLDTTSPLPCYRVTDDAPQACVAGLGRPRLFVTSGLLSTVDAAELDLVLRHEEAHARHGHNLARFLFRAVPDVLGGTRAGAAIEAAWAAAAELAADREAVGADRDRALQLAATLVRIGQTRLRPTPALLAAALTPGAVLERRVRDLVSPPAADSTARRLLLLAAAGTAVVAALAAADLRAVHALLESVVALR